MISQRIAGVCFIAQGRTKSISPTCRSTVRIPTVSLRHCLIWWVRHPAPEAGAVVETEISLNRVICRAESDGIRIASQVRGRIQLRNCGIALNGSLIENRGDASMTPSRGAVEVLLNHVTCLTAAPMLKMDDTDSNQPGGKQRLMPRLSVRSEGSVFAAQGTDRRLMLTNGSSFVEDLETLVSWNGFNNLYDGFEIYWQIETAALDYASRRQDFAQWVRYWGDRTDSEETNADVLPELAWQNGNWKASSSETWLRNLTPSSFELNAAIFIPGVGSLQLARDGFVPGVNAAELPRFPQQPAKPVSDPALSPLGNPTAATDRTKNGRHHPSFCQQPATRRRPPAQEPRHRHRAKGHQRTNSGSDIRCASIVAQEFASASSTGFSSNTVLYVTIFVAAEPVSK